MTDRASLSGTDLRSASRVGHDPASDPLIGTLLEGRYELQHPLGRGGMGQVYAARQVRLDRKVAVKIVHAEDARNPELRARFNREAVALAQINHPNVLHAYDHGVMEDGRLFLVTEMLSGRPLDRLLAAAPHRLLPLDAVLTILTQLAAALDAVHAKTLVHRDVKPNNLCIEDASTDLKTKLLDFGIVRPTGESRLTSVGLVGTPPYMAPEQVRQDQDIDARSDLYSFGITAYELLTGAPPFVSSRHVEVLIAHLEQPVPPLPLEREGGLIPPPLRTLVHRLLEKERGLRPQSALEVKDVLEAIDAFRPGPVTLPTQIEASVPPIGFTPAPEELALPSKPADTSFQAPLNLHSGTDQFDAPLEASSSGRRLLFLVPVLILLLGLSYGLLQRLAAPVVIAPGSVPIVVEPASPEAPLGPAPQIDELAGAQIAEPAETHSSVAEEGAEPPELHASGAENEAEGPEATTSEVGPAANGLKPTTSEVESTTSEVGPAASGLKPTTSEVESTTSEVESTTSEVEPTKGEVEPQSEATEPGAPFTARRKQPPKGQSRGSAAGRGPRWGTAVVTGSTVLGQQVPIQVLLRGRLVGQGVRVRLRLDPGRHTLVVRRVGEAEGRTRTVQLRRGEVTVARVLLD